MHQAPGSGVWQAAFRRHERLLAAAWLLLSVLAVGALALPPVRAGVLQGLQALVNRWDDRWTRRLAEGDALFRAGRFAEAEVYLERLDREFPARDVRHARDKQRERLLTLLGRTYEALGKKGKAMDTFARLVAFDPLNYNNHFEQARAAERLLSGWAIAPEARDGYLAVLALMPYHLPSVRGVIEYYADRGEFIPIIEHARAYLDAFLIQRVVVSLGDSSVTALVMADGQPHDLVLPLPAPAGWHGDLTINPGGFAVEPETLELQPALAVGSGGRSAPVPVPLLQPEVREMDAASHRSFVPRTGDATLSVPVTAPAPGVESVRLRLRIFKPMDAGLWKTVRNAYRNRLDATGLAEAEARTALFPSAEAADSAYTRLAWAREGQELKVDDGGN